MKKNIRDFRKRCGQERNGTQRQKERGKEMDT